MFIKMQYMLFLCTIHCNLLRYSDLYAKIGVENMPFPKIWQRYGRKEQMVCDA